MFEKYQKWTSSSLIKWTDREWSNFLTSILRNDNFTEYEKNRRINEMLELIKTIHNNCLDSENGWSFKRDKK